MNRNIPFVMSDQEKVIVIPREGNCEDTFEPLEEGAWRWTRRSPVPVDAMRMTLVQQEPLVYWQVPAVNYNGNGWGSGAQYSGYVTRREALDLRLAPRGDSRVHLCGRHSLGGGTVWRGKRAA